jgi:glycosidase
LPFVYYGEEIGMRGEKPDERLRTPMQWNEGPTGGFTTGQPWQALQGDQASVNVASQLGDPYSLLNLYRRLVHLHDAHPALGHGNFVPIESSVRSVTAYLRLAGDDVVLVVLNFGDERADRPAFSLEPGAIAPGTYQPLMLLGGVPTPAITVGEDGSLTVGTGVISIPADATWVYQLRPASSVSSTDP